jgi:hypothetical protein
VTWFPSKDHAVSGAAERFRIPAADISIRAAFGLLFFKTPPAGRNAMKSRLRNIFVQQELGISAFPETVFARCAQYCGDSRWEAETKSSQARHDDLVLRRGRERQRVFARSVLVLFVPGSCPFLTDWLSP